MQKFKPDLSRPTRPTASSISTFLRNLITFQSTAFVAVAFMFGLFMFGGCAGKQESNLSDTTRQTVDTASGADMEAARLEALRLDSLRQDSIRQDSIRRNFDSPDLSFHELHGRVKKCEISNTREISYIEYPVLEFNRNGEWVNDGWREDRKIVKEEHPADLNSKVTRDGKGYISKVKFLGDFEEMCAENIVWKDGRIAEARNAENPKLYTSYRYDGDKLAETTQEDSSEAFEHVRINKKYTYVDFDEIGNWTKRKVNETVVGNEWGVKKPHRENNNYYEVRKITYF